MLMESQHSIKKKNCHLVNSVEIPDVPERAKSACAKVKLSILLMIRITQWLIETSLAMPNTPRMCLGLLTVRIVILVIQHLVSPNNVSARPSSSRKLQSHLSLVLKKVKSVTARAESSSDFQKMTNLSQSSLQTKTIPTQ